MLAGCGWAAAVCIIFAVTETADSEGERMGRPAVSTLEEFEVSRDMHYNACSAGGFRQQNA
jgi:hypothetical protein